MIKKKTPVKNKSMHRARLAKNDEFYTQKNDIENELHHYDDHFNGKVVYCNCDDPQVSEFYKYFKNKFKILRLQRIITATYRSENPENRRTESDLVAERHIEYNKKGDHKERVPAISLEYSGVKTGRPRHLKGNGDYHGGDFRSDESIALLKQSDVVVTNPPFSLFRQYVKQLIEYKKKFVIIGPLNSVHYKDIFPLFRDNLIWLGHGFSGGNAFFGVPPNTKQFANGVYDEETGLVKFRNACWFTNINIKKRHDTLPLSKRYRGNKDAYPKYDNYEAINVDKVVLIPKDYAGVMGVPDSFLQQYNPDQFELIDNLGNGRVRGVAKYSRMLIRNKTL